MANNLIQIKRSLNTANPVSLANGELAFSANSNQLFIGSPNGSIIAIGGLRTPGTLTANQSLVANTTSGIDRIITANAIVTTLTANGTTGTAGQVLVSNGTVAYWANPTSSSFTIAGESGTDTFNTGETLTFAAANGVTTTVTNNQVAFSVDTGSTLTVNTIGIHVNTGNLVIATSQLSGDVALGTQTSGNYVATITAGNGISGSSASEGGAATIAVVANNGLVSNSTGVFVVAGSGIASNSTGTHVLAGSGIASNSTGTHVLAGTAGGLVSNSTGVWVTAGSGLVANATGVHVGSGNGVSISADAIDVLAGTAGGLVSNSTGVFVTAGSGLVANATGVHVGTANGITVAADTVGVLAGSTLTVNATGVHVNSALSITDLSLSGNLTVLGTLTTVDTSNLTVKDSLIELANGNVAADLLDIGLYGQYAATGTKYTGFFRDASDSGIYKLFNGLTVEPTTTVDTSNTSYTIATLQTFLNSGGLVSNATNLALTANSTCNVAIVANNISWSGLATNGVIYGGASGAFTSLSAGAGGTVLMVSTAGVPEFATLDGGTF